LEASGELLQRRAEQARSWMWSETAESLLAALREDQSLRQRIPELEREVMAGRLPATVAARQLLDLFLGGGRD
ncbi:MAG: ATPase/protein kinase, partial [Candidatus Sedimenticola endophacoides]